MCVASERANDVGTLSSEAVVRPRANGGALLPVKWTPFALAKSMRCYRRALEVALRRTKSLHAHQSAFVRRLTNGDDWMRRVDSIRLAGPTPGKPNGRGGLGAPPAPGFVNDGTASTQRMESISSKERRLHSRRGERRPPNRREWTPFARLSHAREERPNPRAQPYASFTTGS